MPNFTCIYPHLIAFAICFIASLTTAQAQDLQVERGILTDSVDRMLKTYRNVYVSPVAKRQISFWTLMRGSSDMLDNMKQDSKGQLRIRHVWRRYIDDEVQTEHDQLLSVGSKEDLQALTNELNITGTFTWRTWSDKKLTPGNWRIDVLLENYEPVKCLNANGEILDCSFPFQVK